MVIISITPGRRYQIKNIFFFFFFIVSLVSQILAGMFNIDLILEKHVYFWNTLNLNLIPIQILCKLIETCFPQQQNIPQR